MQIAKNVVILRHYIKNDTDLKFEINAHSSGMILIQEMRLR